MLKNTDSFLQSDFSSLFELKGLINSGEGKKILKELREEEKKRDLKFLN